jgi:hypothetical protein
MSTRAYYGRIRQVVKKIVSEVVAQKWPGQPEPVSRIDDDGQTVLEPPFVYIVSIENIALGVRPGHMFLSPLRLAAERIVCQTHVLATAAQIDDYRAMQRKHRELWQAEDAKLRKTFKLGIKLPGENEARQ